MSLLILPSSKQGPIRIQTLADLFDGDNGFAYEFDNLSTLWQDTGGTVPVTTSGQTIARVDDVSGNGFNATQSTAGSRPTYTESGSTAYSNHANDYLKISSSTSTLKWLHGDGGTGIAALVRFSSGARRGLMGSNSGNDFNTGMFYTWETSSSMQYRVLNSSSNVYNHNYGSSTVLAGTDVFILENAPAGGPVEGYVDGDSIGTASRLITASTANAAFDLEIGATGAAQVVLTGRIYQLIVRDAPFTADEIEALGVYFAGKL